MGDPARGPYGRLLVTRSYHQHMALIWYGAVTLFPGPALCVQGHSNGVNAGPQSPLMAPVWGNTRKTQDARARTLASVFRCSPQRRSLHPCSSLADLLRGSASPGYRLTPLSARRCPTECFIKLTLDTGLWLLLPLPCTPTDLDHSHSPW